MGGPRHCAGADGGGDIHNRPPVQPALLPSAVHGPTEVRRMSFGVGVGGWGGESRGGGLATYVVYRGHRDEHGRRKRGRGKRNAHCIPMDHASAEERGRGMWGHAIVLVQMEGVAFSHLCGPMNWTASSAG